MKNKIKRLLSMTAATALLATCVVMPSPVTAEGEGSYVPLVNGDVVLNEWKFDFGSAENVMDGYVAVTPDRNVVSTKDYGFIGNDGNGYRMSERYDSFRYQEGQTMNLTVGGNGDNDGIGIIPDENATYPQFTTGEYYPVSFGMYVENGSYYRVKATVTTLDPSKDAKASLYYERRHPVFNQKTIAAGESYTVDFSVDVEQIYFEKSDPKGVFNDDMLNISLLGENAALSSLVIQQIDETASANPTTLWILGDSTVTDGDASVPYFDLQNYTGVGAYISKYLPSTIAVSNQGEGGLNANDKNHFNIAKNNIKAGDYMYVEYGHNHKNNNEQSYTGEYWLHDYLKSLPKYYDACNAVGATLVVVGPIDRHNEGQYDAATNTWSSSLSGFSEIGKRYVDCLMYGGESVAASFISKWSEIADAAEAKADTTALKAEADQIYADALALGTIVTSNVAFVDLNAHTLDWLTDVTKEGVVENVPVTNDRKLSNFYFMTGRGGATDGTHPNDAGADALAYGFFTTADIDKYPVLAPLMVNFAEGATHEVPVSVSAEIINAGYPSNNYWPIYQALIHYDFAAYIKSVNFNSDGVLESVDVYTQDPSMMSSYSQAYLAVYNKDTDALEGIAISSDHVDNTGGVGIQTLNFNTDLTIGENQYYKVYLWAYNDDPENGNPTTMVPYANVYTQTDIETYLLPGEKTDVETFVYYDKANLNGAGDWVSYGSAGMDLTLSTDDGGVSFARVMSDGAKNGSANQGSFYVLRNMTNETGSSGKYMIDIDMKYTSGGGLNFGFAKSYSTKSPFVNNEDYFKAFTVANDGMLKIDDQEIGQLSASNWTNVKYILNMNSGKAEISLAGAAPIEVDVAEYMTFDAPSPDTLKAFVMEGQKVAFDVSIANLTVAKLYDDNATIEAAVRVAPDSVDKGTAYINEEGTSLVSASQGSNVTLKAVPKDGYIFVNWTTDDGAAFSKESELSLRAYKDISLTANFAEQSGISGITNYNIAADKGIVKAAEGAVVNLSLENVVDTNGNPVVAGNSDAKWSCAEPGVTVDENGVVTFGADFAIDPNSTKEVAVTSTINNVEKTYSITAHSYAFYENIKNGKLSSATFDGQMIEVANKNSIVFPPGDNSFTFTFNEPVAMDSTRTMSYIAAWSGSKNCGQARYIELYDSTGAKVLNEVIGYSWSELIVGGTPGGSSISDGTSFGEAIAKDSWSIPVTVTINTDGTGTVTFGDKSAAVTVNTAAKDIASIKLISFKGAPAYTDRALVMTDIIIK